MKFRYNGVDMSKYFRISRVERSIGNERFLEMFDQPKIGTLVGNVRTGPKTIKVYIEPLEIGKILTESLKHELAGVLNVDEPKIMTFDDEPDKYYLGFVQGEISTEKVARWYQRAVITFIVPDGTAHSSTYKRVVDYTKVGNVLTYQIENNGNVDAYPIINIKNNEEAGYFGVANQNGILEIGNIKEEGTEEFKRTEYLLDFKSNTDVPFTKNVGIFNDDAWALTGDIGFLNRNGRTFTEMTAINSKNGQNGASLTFEIPADSNGEVGSLFDYIWWRQAFEMAPDTQGIMKIVVTDQNDEFIFGMQSVKYQNGFQAYFDVLARTEEGTSTILRRFKDLKTTNKGSDNPLALTSGMEDLRRVDDKLTVFWRGSYIDLYAPQMKGMVSKKIHVLFGNFGSKKYPMRSNYNDGCIYLEQLKYAKNFVVKERDIPNKYPTGSKIELNCETNSVFVDGINKNVDVVQGSTFLTIPPGKSELKIFMSDWIVNPPTITINFEERWL
ncbi:distal tail protein Dit [Streptococcus hyovaginalis]